MTKKRPIISILVFVIIFTFLWNQIVFALELPDHPLQNNITFQQPQQKNLPINLHKLFQKQLSRLSLSTIYEKIKPTLKYCLIAIYAKTNPPNQTQNFTQTGQCDRLGRVSEKYGKIDGESYKWKAISYDELGRPTAYKEKIGKVSYRHYDIRYNELGDVAYEKIKASAKSGWGPFSSKSKVLTEYWYGYDEYGQYEKTKENEIYRKVSSNPIGTIIKAIVSIVIIAATWGAATPYVAAAWMAASNFVFALLSGASLKDALIGAAISFIATCVGFYLGKLFAGAASAAGAGAGAGAGTAAGAGAGTAAGAGAGAAAGAGAGAAVGAGAGAAVGAGAGAVTATGVSVAATFASNFAAFLKEGGMTIFFQALSLADSLMVDDRGRGLFEQLFGKWGSVVFEAITVIGGLMAGGKGTTGPPYQLYASLGRLAVSAILTAAGDSIHPYLRQFISAFSTSFLNAWANTMTQQAKETALKEQGFQKLSDGDWIKWEGNNLVRITKEGRLITDVFDNGGNYQYTEIPLRGGAIAITDISGNVQKYLNPLSNGSYAVYSSNGEYEGILQPGARLWIGSTGLFNGSILEADDGRLMIFDWTGTQALERNSVDDLTIYDNFGTKEGYYSASENIYYQYDRDQNLRQITNYNTGNDFFYDPVGTITKIITPNGLTQETVSDLIHKWSFAEGKKLNAIPVYDEDGKLIAVFGTYVNNNEIAGFLMDDKVNNLYRSFSLSGEETQSISKEDFNNYVAIAQETTGNLLNTGKAFFIGEFKDLINEYNLFFKGDTIFDMAGGNTIGAIVGAMPVQGSLVSILANLFTTADNYLEQLRFGNAYYYDKVILEYDPKTQTPEQVIQLAKEKFGEFIVRNYIVHEGLGLIELRTKTFTERFRHSIRDMIIMRVMDGIRPAEVGVTIGPGAKKEINVFGLIKGEAGYFAGQEYTVGGKEFFKGETEIKGSISFGLSREKIEIGPEFGVTAENNRGIPLTGEFTPYGELDIGGKEFDFLQIKWEMNQPIKFEPVISASFHGGYFGGKFKIDLKELWDSTAGLFGVDPAGDDMVNLRQYWNFWRAVSEWWDGLWGQDR